MGCGSCSSGGCSIKKGSSGGASGGCGGCAGGSCNVLSSTDWLGDIFDWVNASYRNLVEVRFKAGRKDFFLNETGKRLFTGDAVMVETGSGLHLGFVSMQGEMAHLQMRKKMPKGRLDELKAIVKIATDKDFDRYEEARNRELPLLYRTREIAGNLKIPMKLSDVEVQADGTKAIFYYSAEERVDFRELIKVLAGEFKLRIEMRQISLRQEAGRLGGIGTCGRELCCSTWLTDFKGVATSAARYQNLSLNPTKLSGQCGRLKCCLNYELDTYLTELKDIPKVDRDLQTQKGHARLQKTDIFRKIMWFSYAGDETNWQALPVDRVRFIQEQNKKGEKPVALSEQEEEIIEDQQNEVKNEDLIALDKKFKSANNKKKKKRTNQTQTATGNLSPKPEVPSQANSAAATPSTGTPTANAAENQNKDRPQNQNRNRNKNRNRRPKGPGQEPGSGMGGNPQG